MDDFRVVSTSDTVELLHDLDVVLPANTFMVVALPTTLHHGYVSMSQRFDLYTLTTCLTQQCSAPTNTC